MAWLLATMVLSFGPRFIWNQRAITLVAVAINVLIGIGLIVVFKNNIKDYDELQRKITLEAFAITLGVTFVVGIPYQLISDYGIVPFRATLAHVYLLMGLTLLTSMYLGGRRYR